MGTYSPDGARGLGQGRSGRHDIVEEQHRSTRGQVGIRPGSVGTGQVGLSPAGVEAGLVDEGAHRPQHVGDGTAGHLADHPHQVGDGGVPSPSSSGRA